MRGYMDENQKHNPNNQEMYNMKGTKDYTNMYKLLSVQGAAKLEKYCELKSCKRMTVSIGKIL